MMENKFEMNKFASIGDSELQNIEGGILTLIPIGYVILGAGFATGLPVGAAIGLNRVNRK
jgi:hypothetical protein